MPVPSPDKHRGTLVLESKMYAFYNSICNYVVKHKSVKLFAVGKYMTLCCRKVYDIKTLNKQSKQAVRVS